MSEQPQQWTPETVSKLMMSQEDDYLAYQAVADAHNATLAAERQKHKTLAHAFESERELRKRYEEQLAAEREEVKALVEALKMIQMAHTLNDTNDIAAAALAKAK